MPSEFQRSRWPRAAEPRGPKAMVLDGRQPREAARQRAGGTRREQGGWGRPWRTGRRPAGAGP